MRIARVPPDGVDYIWPQVEPLLAKVMPHVHGEFVMDDIYSQASQDLWQIWILFDNTNTVVGAGVTGLFPYLRGVKCEIIAFATDAPRDRWVPLLSVVEQWAISEGCNRIVLQGRHGWGKLLADEGYDPCYTVLGKNLTPF
jgi:hypothetical protein